MTDIPETLSDRVNHSLEQDGRPPSWHTMTTSEITAQLGVDSTSGLSDAEARSRRARVGPNQLRQARRESIWELLLEELHEPLILLLVTTGILYAFWGELSDALTIGFVILTLAGIEIFDEQRAVRAIAGLSKLAEPTTSVRRGGYARAVPTEDLVPGDLLLLQAGRRVPADARLLEAYGLAADEAALTGESLPAEKDASPILPADAALAERRNMVFSGTVITRGRGSAVVVTTGMGTELGRIAGLAAEVAAPRTPLQVAMKQLSTSLVGVALGVSVLVPLLGWLLAGQPLRQMVLTGLSLAFAMIPEEMPIIITMVLAIGAYRLAQRQAIVKRLQAVETLGAVTVIATDKTGTLTENRMAVSRLEPEQLRSKLLELGVLCNSATDNQDEMLSDDPLDTALLRAAEAAGIDVHAMRRATPVRAEFTFDNQRKLMSVVYERQGGLWAAVKGAPEAVLARSTHRASSAGQQVLGEAERQAILALTAALASDGLRVIAAAEKTLADVRLTQDDAETNLTFVGLIGLADPPRAEARASIADCRAAGIRTIMITGDHPLTARMIAQQVGLDGDERLLTGPDLDALADDALRTTVATVALYARTTPEHKLRIVQALQASGERVAVTGDGINDAPALVAADIGVAMGATGTDVAREAADIVLADDNFATLAHAVEEGRVVFANLTKGVRYYLACKVALLGATLLPVLLQVPVPFAPVQIILMELFMDLAAAASFVAEPPEAGMMRRPPRDPSARFMSGAMVRSIFIGAAGLFAAVSVAYLVAWYSSANLVLAQTVAFATWLLGHVFLAINMRSEQQPLLQLGLFSNRLMILWGLAAAIFILLATRVPWAQAALKTTALSGELWALAVGSALVGTFWMELRKGIFAF